MLNLFKPKKKEVVVEIIRLQKDQYEALEKAVGYVSMNEKTTQLEAAFMLGVQHTLKKLRDGYVKD